MKYGFIYLWFDSKHNRYYIGSHWGTENDNYICSSTAMREAHRDWPQYFKRRVLKKIYTNRLDLLKEEQRWLDMINPEEFGRRYYNISSKAHKGYWWINEETRKIVGAKLSETHKEKYANGEEVAWNKGKKHSKKTIKKLQIAAIKNHNDPEWRKKYLEGNSNKNPIPWNKGKKTGPNPKHSRFIKKWMTENNPFKGKRHTPETINKLKNTINNQWKNGRVHWRNTA